MEVVGREGGKVEVDGWRSTRVEMRSLASGKKQTSRGWTGWHAGHAGHAGQIRPFAFPLSRSAAGASASSRLQSSRPASRPASTRHTRIFNLPDRRVPSALLAASISSHAQPADLARLAGLPPLKRAGRCMSALQMPSGLLRCWAR